MRGRLQLRLLLHAQQGELHLLPPRVAQVPRLQRGGSMTGRTTAKMTTRQSRWRRIFFPTGFVEGDEVARRRLLARGYCLTVVCRSTMVPVDLKHCGRLETVEFIAGQFAFVYET